MMGETATNIMLSHGSISFIGETVSNPSFFKECLQQKVYHFKNQKNGV